MFIHFLQKFLRDTDEHSHKEMLRTRLGRGLSARASVPMKLWYAILLVHECVLILLAGRFPNPVLLGFFWRLLYIGMIDYIMGH
jgi:hypothetical protein